MTNIVYNFLMGEGENSVGGRVSHFNVHFHIAVTPDTVFL